MKRRTFLGVLPFVGGLFAARKGFFEAIGEPSGPGVAIGVDRRSPLGPWLPYQREYDLRLTMVVETMEAAEEPIFVTRCIDPSTHPWGTVFFEEITQEEFKRRYPDHKVVYG